MGHDEEYEEDLHESSLGEVAPATRECLVTPRAGCDMWIHTPATQPFSASVISMATTPKNQNATERSKLVSDSTRKRRVTTQDVQRMQIEILELEKKKILIEVENMKLLNKKYKFEVEELQARQGQDLV